MPNLSQSLPHGVSFAQFVKTNNFVSAFLVHGANYNPHALLGELCRHVKVGDE